MRYGMVIDLGKCIGCQTCAVACKMHNSQPPGMWWNRVFTQGTEEHQTAIGKDGNFKMEFLPLSCQMCENPPCQKVCPTGATHTAEGGVVLVDYNKCIGCRYCFNACPYGVRQFNWTDPKEAKLSELGYEYGYPFDQREEKTGQVAYTQERPAGVAEKCTFCAQYTTKGELPACVRSCPANARYYGDLDDPASDVAKMVETEQVYQLKAEYGTNPKVFYISSSKARSQS